MSRSERCVVVLQDRQSLLQSCPYTLRTRYETEPKDAVVAAMLAIMVGC